MSFEIGGAVRQPVSTPSMEAAYEAAAILETWDVVPMATQGVVDALMGESSELLVVGWRPQAFWRHQVGPARLVRWLVEIDERLAGHGEIEAHREGPTETALYVYGDSNAAMKSAIADFLSSYPLCEGARVVDLTPAGDGADDDRRETS